MNKPCVLVITHVIPFPPSAGNEVRILKLLLWLRSQGYKTVLLLNHSYLDEARRKEVEKVADEVHLASIVTEVSAAARQSLVRCFIECFSNISKVRDVMMSLRNLYSSKLTAASKKTKQNLCPPTLIASAEKLCRELNPIAVIAEYVFTAPCLDAVPTGILKLIDTHDIFSRRDPKEALCCTPEEERNLLLKSNVIIAIQPEEARQLKELVPEREIVIMGIDYDVVTIVDNSSVVSHRILLVGSDNAANIEGLRNFYCNSWPTIASLNPRATLRIVGKVGAHITCSDARVSVVGWVEDLVKEYEQASVVINPTTYGTGLKIKTVEALCRAKPLVATSNSVEGLPCKDMPPWVISDSWPEFAERTIELLEDEENRQRLQELALCFARENFSPRKIYAGLAQVLNRTGGPVYE